MRGMCRKKLTDCVEDPDCGAGDTCGPATSRAVIAKRVLSRLVTDNMNIVNFGLMTYFQDGYYPYHELQSGWVDRVDTVFFRQAELASLGCFDAVTGPSPTCTVYGKVNTLVAATGSRYWATMSGGQSLSFTRDWCGSQCDVGAGARGRWPPT